jgi:very-short-patch-repair endonuclease
MEGVTRFIAFTARGRELERLGGGSLIAAMHDGMLDQDTLVPAFDRAHVEALRTLLFKSWPELRAFDGEIQDRSITFFRQMDKARIELAKEHVAACHAEGRPKGSAGVGPLGVLNAELAKKRAHLPIRQLLDKAGPAIQQLKPVFMMSPLSVAQFLKPGSVRFDLLVMDEASQIEPVDALGAVARAQQLVVVGDERQLPPTAFFKKVTGEDDRDEDDEIVALQAKDAESILDLCLAKGVPHRMLSWHYRSRHQSLIAVSNREFYENKLFIVPSPYDAVAGMGLKFHLLKDAPYDRGGSRTNPREARVIAEAVMRHASEHPDQSLGVGTFSVAQRQAILKELELLRRVNPTVENYFVANAVEPFFVKNLENIQGDERDVIFISVGYGKTEQGYLAHAFGPLSGEGGERRLNVLISRAKLRCEVFCNFTGADIDLERSRSRGVTALKLFLTFAETGNFGLGEATGQDHESEFEFQVSQRLRSLGYDVKAQIGASGFRVDLAVGDPEKPGRFVLGIECDGVQYHSSRSARDRDRLRQQVLEAHGWIIHRIWSADWYLRPREELRKVEAAVVAAKAIWRERDEAGYLPEQAVPISFEAEGTDAVTAIVDGANAPAAAPEGTPYCEADFPVNNKVEPHEAPLAEMADHVAKIVEIEGPIHLDEIATRIRSLWGLHRAGARIRAAVLRATEIAIHRGMIEGGPFYSIPGQAIIVRDRGAVISSSLRKPEMLPPLEIDAALLKVVDDNFGAGRDELIQAAARLFGYAATSAQLRNILGEGVSRLLADGRLIIMGERLVASGQNR